MADEQKMTQEEIKEEIENVDNELKNVHRSRSTIAQLTQTGHVKIVEVIEETEEEPREPAALTVSGGAAVGDSLRGIDYQLLLKERQLLIKRVNLQKELE